MKLRPGGKGGMRSHSELLSEGLFRDRHILAEGRMGRNQNKKISKKTLQGWCGTTGEEGGLGTGSSPPYYFAGIKGLESPMFPAPTTEVEIVV